MINLNKGGEIHMMRYGWGYPMGGFGLLTWIPELIFWLILVFLFISLFRHWGRHDGPHHHWEEEHDQHSPLDILKERYAKGEIDKKQFEEMKKDLIKD
jgi:putative membrane protein